jgi:molybdopterin synthase sulfur carrier subunit
MAQVRLPGNLVVLFPGLPRRLEVDGASVREVLAGLEALVAGVEDRVLAAGPAIREHLRVFVDGDLADLDTPVGPASEVLLLLAISGG